MLLSQAKPPHWTPWMSAPAGSLPPLLLLCNSCSMWQPEKSLYHVIQISQVTPLLKTLHMTSHHGHKNENKPNSSPWPARPSMVRPWLPLQTHFPGASPFPLPCSHWPSPISGSFHWLLLTTLCPRPPHGCVLGVDISTQTSSPLGGHFWPTLLRWIKHTHTVTLPRDPILSPSWHAFSLCHPTRMSSSRTGTPPCSPLYPPAPTTVLGTS